MDRIAALRNIEDALAAYERGEADLATTEETVLAVLRTYATEFDELDAYRAHGDDPADGTVVAAESRPAARERVRDLLDAEEPVDPDDLEFELELVG